MPGATKNALKITAKRITRLEQYRACSGQFRSSDQSVERKIHEAQITSWDTRKALAISTIHRWDAPISYLRSLLQRGNLEEAREALRQLKDVRLDPATLSQVLFEETRLAFFESDWPQVVQVAGEALRHETAAATCLALSQLRANAHFEMGRFSEACADVESVEQLGRVLPHAVSLLYAQLLKVRIVARDSGPRQADAILRQILDEKISLGRTDLDLLLTYLRVRIDLNRLQQLSCAGESAACFLIADAIGDKLYRALAELDWQSAFAKSPDELSARISDGAKGFRRVNRILDEVCGRVPASTSAKTLLEYLASAREKPRQDSPQDSPQDSKGEWLIPDSYSLFSVVLRESRLIADLSSGKVVQLSTQGQTLRALEALSSQPPSKAEFFAAIWGAQRYSPRLHDTLISSLLHRLKKECGIVARVQEGRVRLSRKSLIL